MPILDKIIVALDFPKEELAFDFLATLPVKGLQVKIGKEMFCRFGPRFVEKVLQKGYEVFLDLKLHDIPNTVHKALLGLKELGVFMTNVHASGGKEMLLAAKEACQDQVLLIGVTVLTSFAEENLLEIGVSDSVAHQASRLAELCHSANLDGVVCSPLEVPNIKTVCAKSFLTVTPGIRLTQDHHDQKRVMTPSEALKQGSDYLVIGRALTQAENPELVLEKILVGVN